MGPRWPDLDSNEAGEWQSGFFGRYDSRGVAGQPSMTQTWRTYSIGKAMGCARLAVATISTYQALILPTRHEAKRFRNR